MSPARTAAMTIGSTIGNVLCFTAIASPARAAASTSEPDERSSTARTAANAAPSASVAHQPERRDGCRTYDHTSEDDERKRTPDEGGEYVEAVVIDSEEPSGGVPHADQRSEEVEQGGALMKPEGLPIPVYERDDRVLREHLLQLEPRIGSMDRIDAQGGPGNERHERRRRQANPDAHAAAGHRCWLRTTVYDQRPRGRSRLPKSSRRARSAAPARERPRAGQPKR